VSDVFIEAKQCNDCARGLIHNPHYWQAVSGTQFRCNGYDGTISVEKKEEAVNHPPHYNQYKGLEIIDLVEQMNFNRGNAVKYIARAGFKDQSTEIEDLKKAAWYLNREIERLGG